MKLQSIIDSVHRLGKNDVTGSVYKPPLARICNFEDYYRNKLRTDGGEESPDLAKLREFHEQTTPRRVPVIKKPWTYTEGGWDHVFVTLNVTRGGRVKIALLQPFVELYNNYQSKAIQSPVEERVRLMKQARYPEAALIKLIKNDQKWKKDSEKNKQFLEKIYGRNK